MRIVIGRVGRPHGLDGAFVVDQASDDGRWWQTGARFLAGGERVEVVSHRRSSGRPVVKLDRPVPRGAVLEVERRDLPLTAEDEYYVFELVGLEVVEEGGRVLGIVHAVESGVANDSLDLGGGVLLPMVEDCILRIDVERGRIEVAHGFTE